MAIATGQLFFRASASAAAMARFACSSEIGAPYAICAGALPEKPRIAQAARGKLGS